MNSVTSATTAQVTVYQSRMPFCTPTRQLVQSGSKKKPSALSGTPRMTFAQCRSEEDRQQNARQSEDDVAKAFPKFVLDATAKLDTNGSKHEQPQNHH